MRRHRGTAVAAWIPSGALAARVAACGVAAALSAFPASAAPAATPAPAAGHALTRSEARVLGRDAYLYAYPMIEHYRTIADQLGDPSRSDVVGEFGRFLHSRRIPEPDDRDVATPSLDTLGSIAWLDLRTEPWILVMPDVKDRRYHSVQLVDLYTFNFAYLGSRATGAGGGRYLVAGPRWKGSTPKGIRKVIRSETDLVMIRARTAVRGADDIDALRKIQAGYDLWPLSAYFSRPAPPSAPPIKFLPFDEERARSAGFIEYLNFVLAFCQPPNPKERDLLQRFARLGIGPGRPFDAAAWSPDAIAGLEAGIQDARNEIAKADRGPGSMRERFGTRKALKGDYLKRAIGADQELYGDSVEEVWTATLTGDGTKLSTIRFPKGERPQGRFNWSMTLYTLPDRALYANPRNRYSLGDREKGLVFADDKSLTLYVGHKSPGAGKESNWLPAPEGPYIVVLRIYGPNKAEIDGDWTLPPLVAAGARKKQ